MNTKDNQRSRITKMLMKQAYLKLMTNKQAAKITVKEICEKAEVNRSTFYLHYVEPNDILKELEDETIHSLIDFLQAIGGSHQSPKDARNYLMSFLRYIQRNDELFHTLLIDNSDPHFRKKFQAIALQIIENAFDIELSKEIKSIVYLYIVSGCIEILIDWIKNHYVMSENELCDILYALCEGSLSKYDQSKSTL